jgi:hypothetical protein
MSNAANNDRWFDVEDQGHRYRWDPHNEDESFGAPEKLGKLLVDIAYAETRMSSDAYAAQFSFALAGWLDRIAAVKRQHDKAWWTAQSGNGRLIAAEAALADLGQELLLFFHDAGLKETPRARRYLDSTAWSSPRLEGRRDVSVLQSWLDTLASEPEAALRALAPRYKAALAKGLAGLEHNESVQADLAAAERAVDEISSKIFALFHRLEVKLAVYGEENGLPDRWSSTLLKP